MVTDSSKTSVTSRGLLISQLYNNQQWNNERHAMDDVKDLHIYKSPPVSSEQRTFFLRNVWCVKIPHSRPCLNQADIFTDHVTVDPRGAVAGFTGSNPPPPAHE